MQKISCGDNSNTVNTSLKISNAHSKTVCETNCTYDNETFTSDLINLKEEEEDDDDENSLLGKSINTTNDNTNSNKSVNNFIKLNNRKNYMLSSSSSVSSSSSTSSTSSISPVPFNYSNTKKQLKKYHHHHHHHHHCNQQNVKLNYNKCICKLDQKQFDCFQCTQNYPINVRRSKDGEEDYNYFYTKNDASNIDNNNHVNENTNKIKVLFSSMDNEAASASSEPVVLLKPSPIPVSSSLLSLLALTKPSNTFVPPPNKCLVQSHLFGKASSSSQSSSSASSSHSNKN